MKRKRRDVGGREKRKPQDKREGEQAPTTITLESGVEEKKKNVSYGKKEGEGLYFFQRSLWRGDLHFFHSRNRLKWA